MMLNLSYSLIETGPIVCLIRVPFDANVETVPHFAFEPGAELAAEKRCDVVGLDGVNSGARQVIVDSLQVRLFAENDIGGVLALVCAPVISSREIAINRTVPTRELVQLSMHALGCPSVGDPLGAWPVRDFDKGVVDEPIFDTLLTQLTGQPVVAIEVDLQPAGQPCRYAHVAQAQLFVDEIEIVMKAFAIIGNQIRLAGLVG